MTNLRKTLTKCLFPAAGYGTRFLPATKAMPKEMMPIVTKPLIHYAVEEALQAGMTEMGVVYGKHKTAIPNYFDEHFELDEVLRSSGKEQYLKDVRDLMDKGIFMYMRQRQMLGLGHAILTGRPMINENHFGVILADDLCINIKENDLSQGDSKLGSVIGDNIIKQLTKIHIENDELCVVAVEKVPRDQVSKYGIIAGDNLGNGLWQVREMVEKPSPEEAPSDIAIIGRYILRHEIFGVLEEVKPDKNGEIQITTALNELAKQGKVLAYEFEGTRFDCGQLHGFMHASKFFYENLLLAK